MQERTVTISQEEMDAMLEHLLDGTQTAEEWMAEHKSTPKQKM